MLTVEPGSPIPVDPHAKAALAQFIVEAEDDAEDDDPKRFMTAMEKAYRCGFVHAQDRARKLSTIPPEPWREGDPAWRVGHRLGRTLYHFGMVAGLVDTAALAAELVEATTAMEARAVEQKAFVIKAAFDTSARNEFGDEVWRERAAAQTDEAEKWRDMYRALASAVIPFSGTVGDAVIEAATRHRAAHERERAGISSSVSDGEGEAVSGAESVCKCGRNLALTCLHCDAIEDSEADIEDQARNTRIRKDVDAGVRRTAST